MVAKLLSWPMVKVSLYTLRRCSCVRIRLSCACRDVSASRSFWNAESWVEKALRFDQNWDSVSSSCLASRSSAASCSSSSTFSASSFSRF